MRLAERKHQRDANIRSRSASREPSGHRDSTTTNATAPADEQQPTYLPRNYDYYELYTMPARYMHRIENPERYKSSGTVPRNNIRDDQDRIILAESGLSKVTRMRQERSGRSPSPAAIITRAASSDASASVSISQHQKQHHQQKMTQQVVDKSESASTSGNGQASADRAMRMSELSATGTASVTSAPTSRAPSTVPFSVPPSSSSAPPALLQSNLSIKVDDGGKYYTHPAEGRPMRVPSPMHDRSQRAASPGNYGAHGPSREDVGSQANVSVRIIAKEGIEQKKHLSRKMREQQLAEFNRRHFLSKESKEAK